MRLTFVVSAGTLSFNTFREGEIVRSAHQTRLQWCNAPCSPSRVRGNCRFRAHGMRRELRCPAGGPRRGRCRRDTGSRAGSLDRGDVARRRAHLPGRLPRPPCARQRLVVVVKHVPERGGRLRRLPEGKPGARLPRHQRRRHAGRGQVVPRSLRLDLAVDSGSGTSTRAQARRELPAARHPDRRARRRRGLVGGRRRCRDLGSPGREAAVTGVTSR
jgi:hypothetical protein